MGDIVILRHQLTSHFTTLDNNLIRDRRLSWKATGLLVYLLSLSGTYKLHISRLSKEKLDGRDATMSAIRELQRTGYVTIEQLRGAEGQFGTTRWTIHDNASGQSTSVPLLPSTENPFADDPTADKPYTEVPQLRSTNREEISTESTTSTNSKIPTGQIVYPHRLAAEDCEAIACELRDLSPQAAQAVVDELAGAMSIPGRISGSPIEYASGIARKARAGKFKPRLGIGVARERASTLERELARKEHHSKRLDNKEPSEHTRAFLKEEEARIFGRPTSSTKND